MIVLRNLLLLSIESATMPNKHTPKRPQLPTGAYSLRLEEVAGPKSTSIWQSNPEEHTQNIFFIRMMEIPPEASWLIY